MMDSEIRRITLPLTVEIVKTLHAGDSILLNGEMLTARDQVWTGLFEHRILAYNTAAEQRTVGKTKLAGRHIIELERRR